MDIDVTEPAPPDSAFRRRLLGIGLGGAAVSLLPWLVGRASATTTTSSATSDTTPTTTTTAPPKRPSGDDVELLGFAETVEIAAFRLYEEIATDNFDDDERAVIATFHDAHEAYAQSLSGFLGRDAPQVLNPVYDEMREAFGGDKATALEAAYNLESVAVATHTDILEKLQGTDGAALIASILIVEAAHGTVLADIAGEADLDRLLVVTEADALTPAGEGDVVSPHDHMLGRRDILRIGGFGVATAAVISACGAETGEVGRVGSVSTTVPLPDVSVTNATLLRTASSLEHSIVNVYSQVIGNSDLLDPSLDELIQRFLDDHTAHAELFEKLTTDGGGTAWTCSNPKIDDVIIKPVLDRIIKGVPATGAAAEVPPSDDPRRDILNFAHGLEAMAGATCQSFVVLYSDASLRSQAMTVGANESRHAALLAFTINPDRPGGWVNFNDAVNAEPAAPPTTTIAPSTTQNIANAPGASAPTDSTPPVPQTEIPTVTAIPSQFGSLAANEIVVGAGDENGTRLKVNLETPSLNSFVYEYMQPSC